MATGRLYKNCDHIFGIKNAKGTGTDGTVTTLNNGTCTYSIVDAFTGSTMMSGTIPYISNSTGNYLMVVDASALSWVIVGRKYVITVTISCNGFDSASEMDVIGDTYKP